MSPESDAGSARAASRGERGRPLLGVLGGVVAAVVGAVVWAVIIAASNYKIGLIAVALGALVGFAVGRLGGRDRWLVVVAVVLALLGTALGDTFVVSHVLSSATGLSETKAVTMLARHLSLLRAELRAELGLLDVLFFALAGMTAARVCVAEQGRDRGRGSGSELPRGSTTATLDPLDQPGYDAPAPSGPVPGLAAPGLAVPPAQDAPSPAPGEQPPAWGSGA